MKGTLLKLVIGFTIAGATGGGIWLYLRWRKKNREDDEVLSAEYFFDKDEADRMLKEEIEKDPRSKIDVYAEVRKSFGEDTEGDDVMRDEDDEGKGPHDIDRGRFAKGVREYSKSDDEKRNFEEYMAAMMSPEDDDEDEEDDIYDEDEPKEKHGSHYPITAAQFCNTRNYYDKVSLSYFTDDDVVCDEKDKVMDNANEVLGRLQDLFEGDDEYPTVCYIRNEELEIDYEISIIEGSYRREVLGEGV